MTTQSIKSTDSTSDDLTPRFSLRTWTSNAVKRGFDIIISGFGLLILSPLFLYIAILIKRDSAGPVFYRGPRLGRGGRPFGILKFRTMREEAASYEGPPITAEDDGRITPLGKWLRDSKVNELPQLWNVLMGEMSLVGPRPEDPVLAETWPRKVRAEILSVRPGITSPSSVLFRDEEKILNAGRLMDIYLGEIQPSKLRLDQLYVRHHSFLLDLDVILWTFLVVTVPSLRGHKPPEATLFWGPISRLSRRYISWFFLDAITMFIAFGLVGVYERLFIAPLDLGLPQAMVIAFAYSILFSSVAAVLGVQKISWTSASAGDVLELVPPTLLALVTTLAVNYWLNFLPSKLILDATILAFLGFIFTRYRSRILTGVVSRWLTLRKDSLTVRERVLIVGAGDTGQFVAWRLKNSNESSSYQVIGFVDDDMFRQGLRLNGFTVLGKRENIAELVKNYDIGVIIFAIHNISASERASILKTCRSTNARVVAWPDIFRLIRPQTPPQKYAGSSTDQTQASNDAKEFLEPEELISWLDILEINLGQGDYASVTEQIHGMRTMLFEKHPDKGAKV